MSIIMSQRDEALINYGEDFYLLLLQLTINEISRVEGHASISTTSPSMNRFPSKSIILGIQPAYLNEASTYYK